MQQVLCSSAVATGANPDDMGSHSLRISHEAAEHRGALRAGQQRACPRAQRHCGTVLDNGWGHSQRVIDPKGTKTIASV